jgi:hypothetical protein
MLPMKFGDDSNNNISATLKDLFCMAAMLNLKKKDIASFVLWASEKLVFIAFKKVFGLQGHKNQFFLLPR